MSTRPSAACQEGGFVRDRWTAGAGATCTASWSFGCYCGREDERGGIIAGETYKANKLVSQNNGIGLGVEPSLE